MNWKKPNMIKKTIRLMFYLYLLVGLSCTNKLKEHQDEHPHEKQHEVEQKNASDPLPGKQYEKGHNNSKKHEHDSGGPYGEGFGIEKYNERSGVVLAEAARNRLKIQSRKASSLKTGHNLYLLPNESIIHEEDHTGIYVKRENWFKFKLVTITNQKRTHSLVRIHIEQDADIIVHSAGLLRLAELNAAGASGEGHGH